MPWNNSNAASINSSANAGNSTKIADIMLLTADTIDGKICTIPVMIAGKAPIICVMAFSIAGIAFSSASGILAAKS